MATAGDLINASLREIGVLAAGETPAAADSADGLSTLNRLIDKWNAEQLRVYTVTRTEWTITASTQQYAVGASQTVNVARPVWVENIHYQDTSGSLDIEFPLDVLTEQEWADIRIKDQTATLPSKAYYNPTYPYAAIDLWPIPTSSTLEGVLYAWAVLGSFTATTTSVSLPPGYEEMIVTNLALRLAPSYAAPIHPELKERARDAIAAVKTVNIRLVDLEIDPSALLGGGRGGYDIQTG